MILSAGSINSPKILMLSGIGSREEWEKYGISVISNLSVGRNVQDHVGFYGLVTGINFPSTSESISMQEVDISSYEMIHRGPLSAIGVNSATTILQNSVPTWE